MLSVDRLARFWNERDSDFFAEAFVRDPKHRRFMHCGVGIDRSFDFGAVDVLSAAQHHVLGAVLNKDEALFVHASEIAAV